MVRQPSECVRLASIAVTFPLRQDLGVPTLLKDWNVEPESSSAAFWTIARKVSQSPEFHIDGAKREALIGRVTGKRGARWALSLSDALFELLLYLDVLPVHAAGFTSRDPEGGASLLFAPSGGGKSSLSWLAMTHGRGLLSDDHLGLRRGIDGLEIIPLKRSIAVDSRLLRQRPNEALEEQMLAGGRKLRFDPETLEDHRRVLVGSPRRLIFLEKGSSRRIEALGASEAFTRLVPQSAGLKPSGRRLLPMLRDLANEVPAKVVTLTRSCLEDPGVLDQLGA